MSTAKFDTWQDSSGTNEFYKCRAWVNFNGTGTVAIRESGNVDSITDNGTGDYTVNFTNALPDADYSISFSGGSATTAACLFSINKVGFSTTVSAPTVASFRFATGFNTGLGQVTDADYCNVSVFR